MLRYSVILAIFGLACGLPTDFVDGENKVSGDGLTRFPSVVIFLRLVLMKLLKYLNFI